MIPANAIIEWGQRRPWPTQDQIEQDLLLARCIVEIYTDPYLANELIFRGGTCLHQLHLPAPLRYSEDLDFVRVSAAGIGTVFDHLRDMAARVGFEKVTTNIGTYPKARLRAVSESGRKLTVKIEVNTYERPMGPQLPRIAFAVKNRWFTGRADVLTFAPAELVATKLRALYERKKGRDLFDLWLALTQLQLLPVDIAAAFQPYRPDKYNVTDAVANLRAKIVDPAFVTDLDQLLADPPAGYSVETAASLVIDELLSLV